MVIPLPALSVVCYNMTSNCPLHHTCHTQILTNQRKMEKHEPRVSCHLWHRSFFPGTSVAPQNIVEYPQRSCPRGCEGTQVPSQPHSGGVCAFFDFVEKRTHPTVKSRPRCFVVLPKKHTTCGQLYYRWISGKKNGTLPLFASTSRVWVLLILFDSAIFPILSVNV